jgi:diacylglycerol kinase (ATP)
MPDGVLAIVNPVAGRGAGARVWARIRTEMGAWSCVTTARAGQARELAAQAAADGIRRVVAIGGDGTVFEVANGLARSQTELAIIPTGTGNDLATNLGVPRDPVAAARLANSGSAHSIDLGKLQSSTHSVHFANVAGFGFDAAVAWRVNRLPRLVGGTLPYLVGVIQTLWQYRAPRIRLRIDAHELDERIFLVAVGNCASYGGGMRIVPDAQPNDGSLDVCVVKDLPRREVLGLLPRLYSGAHVSHPAVKLFRCRALSAETDARVFCQADGELVGGLPAHFSIQPATLRCVTPLTRG